MDKIEANFRNDIEKEDREYAAFPEIIRRRIKYFGTEIPRVLCRGNAKEVKYMTIAVNFSYKNIEHSIRSSISASVDEDKFQSLCALIKKKYTEVVHNATQMIKRDFSI